MAKPRGININVLIPERMLEKMDGLIKNGHFMTRSEIVREGIKVILDKFEGKK